MNNDEPTPTVPRTPQPSTHETEDTKPRVLESASEDTTPRVQNDDASEDPNRTADHGAPSSRSATETIARTPSDVSRMEATATELAKDGVPGYAILSELGKGGMGVVHKARHIKLNRVVALKMMLGGENASRNDMFRFLAEAEAVAAIKHENVVQVFDYGENDNKPFMALEFCSGGTISKLLPKSKEQATQPREMAALIAKVARGVAAAHALGIIHRDLKPGNVFLDESGVPKVADFGLAKRGEGADVTQAGVGMGTPAYMAPEQARDAKFVGPQADVWALGVMLYEALTGTRPFTGTVQEIMAKAQNAEPLAPRKHVYSIPLDLELICLKCLSKAPHERYATAKELVADLERFERGEAISVRPLGVGERVVRWVRRKPTLAAAYGLSTLAVALALGVFFVFGLYREADSAKNQAESAKNQLAKTNSELEDKSQQLAKTNGELKGKTQELQETNGALEVAKKRAEEGEIDANRLRGLEETAKKEALFQKGEAVKAKDLLQIERDKIAAIEYGRSLQVAHQDWRDGQIPTMRTLLNNADPNLRGWEWRYLVRLSDLSLMTLRGHRNGLNGVALSPDDTRILTAGGDGLAKVWDVKTGNELFTLKGHAGELKTANFSGDGTRMVTGGIDSTAIIWDAKTGKELVTLKGHLAMVSKAVFSSDGTRVVTGSGDNTARVWDAKTGETLLTLKGQGSVEGVAFSPDGTRIVTGDTAKTVKVWDAKTGTELLSFVAHSEIVRAVAYSHDGTRFVTAGWDGLARVWDAKTGKELLTLRTTAEKLYSVAFNRDDTRIAAGCSDSTIRVWDAKTGSELSSLKGHSVDVHGVAWFSDGVRLVSAGREASTKVWDLRESIEVATFKGHPSGTNSAVFSPDGTRIVSAGTDKIAIVRDAKTGTELLTLKGHKRPLMTAAYSPDGTRIITGGGVPQEPCEARVWDAKTGEQLFTLDGHNGYVFTAVFSPDGTRILTSSSDKTAKVWDAKTGKELFTFKEHTQSIRTAAFNHDGTRVVTGGFEIAQPGQVYVWDAKTGERLLTLNGHTLGIGSARFNADSTRIVTSGGDRLVRVWDAKTGAEILSLNQVTSATSAVFNPDSTRIVTANGPTIKVWDAKTGADLLTLKAHPIGVTSVAFSHDGTRIVTSGHDGTMKVWDSRPVAGDAVPK